MTLARQIEKVVVGCHAEEDVENLNLGRMFAPPNAVERMNKMGDFGWFSNSPFIVLPPPPPIPLAPGATVLRSTQKHIGGCCVTPPFHYNPG